jgi:hypothetical protein
MAHCNNPNGVAAGCTVDDKTCNCSCLDCTTLVRANIRERLKALEDSFPAAKNTPAARKQLFAKIDRFEKFAAEALAKTAKKTVKKKPK